MGLLGQLGQQRRPDLGRGGDGGVDVGGRAGGDQALVQVHGGTAVGSGEAPPLEPPDRGGEPVDGGGHGGVAAARQEDAVQLVVGLGRTVDVTGSHRRGEALVRRGHGGDVLGGHAAGRLAGGEFVHRPDDDGGVAHL